MGKSYSQFSLDERCQIAQLRAEGHSLRQIAAALDRAPSSIARELKRNASAKAEFRPAQAQDKARARRWKGSRLERDAVLRKQVLGLLSEGQSPEQVVGRLALEAGEKLLSHESIYRFVYAQIARHNDFSWRHYLPRAKAKRGFRGSKGGSPANFIKDRVSIAQRPPEVSNRQDPGHWEGDLMLFSKYGHAVLMLHERSSRLLIGLRPVNKTASLVLSHIQAMLLPFPEPLRKSITFDNGTEFAQHFHLNGQGIQTYFCDTHSPWQKGGIENAIGRMRRFLPRKTDLATLSQAQFDATLAIYNNTPRKCLDYRTPAEVFSSKLLHFKCESTFRLSPE
jgi:IS30 family transposase